MLASVSRVTALARLSSSPPCLVSHWVPNSSSSESLSTCGAARAGAVNEPITTMCWIRGSWSRTSSTFSSCLAVDTTITVAPQSLIT